METKDTTTAASVSPPGDGQGVIEARNWADTLDSVREELTAGLLYTHNRVNADSAKLLETTAFLHAAIELLAERGLISIDELDDRKRAVTERLMRVFLNRGMGVVLMEPEADKYTYTDVAEVDCANRIHLCQAACCRLSFALSKQDVEETVLRWELGDPYMNRREADGYCHHLDRATLRCSVHKHRPIPCRAYTCRQDKRIWKDFDDMDPQPDLVESFRDRVEGRAVAKLGQPRGRKGEPMILE